MPRSSSRSKLPRLVVANGLSLVLLILFLGSWVGQAAAGWRVYNSEQQEHGSSQIGFIPYLCTGHFVEATAENWESEFLQMGAFVWLTSFLVQKGSPESKAPGESDEHEPVTPDSPWPPRRGGWVLKIYEHSLSLAFLLMFLVSFWLHALGGAREYSLSQLQHGKPPVTTGQYLLSSHFWFESFQNWQSEFLSILMMVVLAIFLRQKGSPESKPVEAPHWRNE